jgi:hypothetical protein
MNFPRSIAPQKRVQDSAGQCRGSAAPVQKQCSTGFWARDLAKVAGSEQGWRLTRQKQYGNNSRSNVQN